MTALLDAPSTLQHMRDVVTTFYRGKGRYPPVVELPPGPVHVLDALRRELSISRTGLSALAGVHRRVPSAGAITRRRLAAAFDVPVDEIDAVLAHVSGGAWPGTPWVEDTAELHELRPQP